MECCLYGDTPIFERMIIMLKGTIKLNDQECEGSYDSNIISNSEKYMTNGFNATFDKETPIIFKKAIDMIIEKYPTNADYLQTFTYSLDGEEIRFWIMIDDYGNGRYVLTALLPEEY